MVPKIWGPENIGQKSLDPKQFCSKSVGLQKVQVRAQKYYTSQLSLIQFRCDFEDRSMEQNVKDDNVKTKVTTKKHF